MLTALNPTAGSESKIRDDSQPTKLAARVLRLQYEADEIRGLHVRLRAPDILVQAEAMNLNLRRGILTLVAPHIALTRWNILIDGSLLILSNQTDILVIYEPILMPEASVVSNLKGAMAECGDQFCIVYDAESSLCPHTPQGYAIRADKVLLRKSGDVDLERPRLYLDEIPIFALPWLRLRPERKPGFTFPRLGFDARGGFIAGPAGIVPVGHETTLEGYVAVRTRQGFETRSALYAPNFTLAINQLYDYPVNEARFQLKSMAPLSNADLFLDLDIITKDRRVIDDMAEFPLARAMTHTASRGRMSSNSTLWIYETYMEFFQSLDSRGYIAQQTIFPSATMALHMPIVPLARFFWPSLDIQLTRHGVGLEGNALDAESNLAPGHVRLEASPSISSVFNLNSLRVSLQAATRHQLWLVDQSTQPSAIHAAAWKMDLSLPLFRDFGAFRHIVEPLVKYQITPWVSGANPPLVIDNFDRIRRGHGVEAGVSTRITNRQHAAAIARVDVYERIELPGFTIDTGPRYQASRGYFGPDRFRLGFDSAWDHHRHQMTLLGLSLSSANDDSSFVELGGRYIGPGDGPHRNAPFSNAGSPWNIDPWAIEAARQIEVYSDAKVPLTRKIILVIGVRSGVRPRIALHAAWYGLEFRSPCGCVSASITASHRPSTPLPDIMTSLSILDL